MAKPGSDRDGAMVDKQAGKKVQRSMHAHTHTHLRYMYTLTMVIITVRMITACRSIKMAAGLHMI